MYITQINSRDILYSQLQEKRNRYVWSYFKLNTPQNFLVEENKSISLVLLDKVNILGSAMLTPKNSDIVRIRIVFIIPTYQKKGLGRRLMYAAEKTAKQMLFKEVSLISPEENFSFYLKMGYTIDGDWWYDKKTKLKTIQLKKCLI